MKLWIERSYAGLIQNSLLFVTIVEKVRENENKDREGRCTYNEREKKRCYNYPGKVVGYENTFKKTATEEDIPGILSKLVSFRDDKRFGVRYNFLCAFDS